MVEASCWSSLLSPHKAETLVLLSVTVVLCDEVHPACSQTQVPKGMCLCPSGHGESMQGFSAPPCVVLTVEKKA